MTTMNVDRDELLRRATRVFNELSRLRKDAKRAAQCERPKYDARAAELGAELRVLLDQRERRQA